ncbi:MAG: S49 family peptidase [Rhodospirillales bacterium]|nr:S49 family peptidase [Rhodospirillales bacterium]
MLDAAGIGGKNPRPEIAKRGFLLYDAANPDLRGSYKLPFADRIGGVLKAVKGGVRAAASRLPQTDAPQREKTRARQILDHYEERIAREEKRGGAGAPGAHALGAHAPGGFGRGTAARRLPFLAQRLFNTPLALHPAKAAVIARAFGERFGIGAVLRGGTEAAAEAFAFEEEDDGPAEPKPYAVAQGIASIPVQGTLVHRLGAMRPYSGMTGYDGVRACLAMALEDPAVRGVLFDIDSPGGEVSGCFELADVIFAARGRKPMWAVVDDCAFSAAYAIASGADKVVVPALGAVGSIGVIALVADVSKAMESAGVVVNVIQFGARKADGLEVLPLSPEGRDRFQADVDTMGARFVETVARNRGLGVPAVRGTEAATFLGAAAVSAGLADMVRAPEAAFGEFLQTLQQGN